MVITYDDLKNLRIKHDIIVIETSEKVFEAYVLEIENTFISIRIKYPNYYDNYHIYKTLPLESVHYRPIINFYLYPVDSINNNNYLSINEYVISKNNYNDYLQYLNKKIKIEGQQDLTTEYPLLIRIFGDEYENGSKTSYFALSEINILSAKDIYRPKKRIVEAKDNEDNILKKDTLFKCKLSNTYYNFKIVRQINDNIYECLRLFPQGSIYRTHTFDYEKMLIDNHQICKELKILTSFSLNDMVVANKKVHDSADMCYSKELYKKILRISKIDMDSKYQYTVTDDIDYKEVFNIIEIDLVNPEKLYGKKTRIDESIDTDKYNSRFKSYLSQLDENFQQVNDVIFNLIENNELCNKLDDYDINHWSYKKLNISDVDEFGLIIYDYTITNKFKELSNIISNEYTNKYLIQDNENDEVFIIKYK